MSSNKNNYEIYDYLSVPNSTVENESDQFLIVQDNGNLFINKQVQYVAQVQSDQGPSDSVQTCSVYDITPQQVYVDVDSPAELISVANLVLPDGSNSLYTNSYFMQELPNSSTSQNQEPCVPNSNNEQLEEGVLVMDDQYRHEDLKDTNLTYPAAASPEKQVANCTEITLNEDQYKMLEEKGWVLFETNDKTFVLDTLGLHDITHNEDVIRQLKTEIHNVNLENDLSIIQKHDDTIDPKYDDEIEKKTLTIDNCENDKKTAEEEKILLTKCVDNGDVKMKDKPPLLSSSESKTKDENTPQKRVTETRDDTTIVLQQKETAKTSKSMLQRNRQVVKLKTTLPAKDIPERIVLGKTIDGKKLVARVVKPNQNGSANEISNSPRNDVKAVDIMNNYISEEQYADSPELLLESLTKQSLRDPTNYYDSPHVINVVSNMKHLLTLPVFKQAVASHNIVVTKVTKTKQKSAEVVTPSPVLVLGKVVHLEYGSEFIHIPHMLNSLLDGSGSLSLADVYHVHITETKKGDGTTEGMSVFIQKRPVPLGDKKKIYACSSCASIFSTDSELLGHRKECLTEKPLKIDTDSVNTDKESNDSGGFEKPYNTIKSKQGTSYVCIKCKMVFNKLCNCLRHVKTHLPQKQTEASDKQCASKEDLFKCNMCPSGYLHPSTLSKHIVQCHIQNKRS